MAILSSSHHLVKPSAQISMTLSRHLSLSFIVSGYIQYFPYELRLCITWGCKFFIDTFMKFWLVYISNILTSVEIIMYVHKVRHSYIRHIYTIYLYLSIFIHLHLFIFIYTIYLYLFIFIHCYIGHIYTSWENIGICEYIFHIKYSFISSEICSNT